ncbi:hypothetical protein [Solirubrobacter soli]|uniref:hypothetical protein n=1 Tax=Solirubrobacter soli TaxID=363832 RepID=UPI0004084E6F|nr:hypothetical protein [Solirubrobacter soli]
MSGARRRLIVVVLVGAVLFVGGAYALGRAIKESNEPLPSSTPVTITSEQGAVSTVGGGPDIPGLITPTPTKSADKTTSTTGPTTTGPTTTGPTTTGPTTTGPTTTGPTTTGPTTTGPTTTTGRGTTRTSSGSGSTSGTSTTTG